MSGVHAGMRRFGQPESPRRIARERQAFRISWQVRAAANSLMTPDKVKSPPTRPMAANRRQMGSRRPESFQLNVSKLLERRRPLRGGVDRNMRSSRHRDHLARRPLRGGVDRNITACADAGTSRVAPFAGAWIETTIARRQGWRLQVAPFAGAWIETSCAGVLNRAAGRPLRGGVDRNISGAPGSISAMSPPSRGRGSKPRTMQRSSC